MITGMKTVTPICAQRETEYKKQSRPLTSVRFHIPLHLCYNDAVRHEIYMPETRSLNHAKTHSS